MLISLWREVCPRALESRQTIAFHRPMLLLRNCDCCFRNASFRLAKMCAVVMISASLGVLLLFEKAWPGQNLRNQESQAMPSKAAPLVLVGMSEPGNSSRDKSEATPSKATPKVLVGMSAPGNSSMGKSEAMPRKAAAPKVFVGIMSGPRNAKMRDLWRNKWQCGKQLKAAGIVYRFIVGWPIDENRSLSARLSGQVATDSETSQANQLRNESGVYQDFKFVHFPDTYLGLQSKTFALFKYGYSLGASYIVKMDDDICVHASRLLIQIDLHEMQVKKGGPQALYAGHMLITKIKGINGVNTSYFSGLCYMLSQDLVGAIVEEQSMDAVLFAPYGSYDEDAQTGRWVSFVQKDHNISVQFMQWGRGWMHKYSAHLDLKLHGHGP